MAQTNGRVGFAEASDVREDFAAGKFAPNGPISNQELDEIHSQVVKTHRADAQLFLIFGQIYMQRRLWHKALSDLYCRCYLLDKQSDAYRQTLQMCRDIERQMLQEITKMPRGVKAALFTRDVDRDLLKWHSKLNYTDTLERVQVEDGIALAPLRQGQLVFKSRPFACAPWRPSNRGGRESKYKNCFHCLELVPNVVDLALETNRVFVACHVKPYGCQHVYCSQECFLTNARVHELECAAIVQISEFSKKWLNFSLCLTVARALIRCFIWADNTCGGNDGSGGSLDSSTGSGPSFTSVRVQGGTLKSDNAFNSHGTALDAILNTAIPLQLLEAKYPKQVKGLRQYARFLLDALGLKVCMHLTPRELLHFAVVIWLYSIPLVPLQSRLNGEMLGGAVFCLDLLSWDHCLTGRDYFGGAGGAENVGGNCKPNCNVYFDANGRLAIRTRASINAGIKLSIDKALDVYDIAGGYGGNSTSTSTSASGVFGESGGASDASQVHGQSFTSLWEQGEALRDSVNTSAAAATCNWIVPSLDDYAHSNTIDTASFIRCSVCVTGFCVPTALDSTKDSANARGAKRLKWRCLNCGIGSNHCDGDNQHSYKDYNEKLNLLLNKAEYIVEDSYMLNQKGHRVAARRALEDFVYNWSGVLHPNHYLLYNAQVLIAGACMNCAGSNYRLALEYLTCAILSLEQRCPWPLQDKGHLSTTLANLCLGIYKTSRGANSLPFKSVGMEAAIDSLWNWTMVAGCRDVATLDALKLCRMVAFEFNIHVPPNMHEVAIVVPGKFLQVFQAATGNTSTIPKSFDKSLENVAGLAFMAAQQGLNNEPLINVMTTLESCGIQQLGTGLGCLGIAASYAHENLVEALCKAIEEKVTSELDTLVTIGAEEFAAVRGNVLNLIAAIVGANELGTTPLLAVASLCSDELGVESGNVGENFGSESGVGGNAPAGEGDNEQKHRRQVLVARHLANVCRRLDALLETHKGAENLKLMYKSSLLKSLFDANTHARLNCQTPLHYAAARGNLQLVEYLSKNSTYIGRMNLEGATPLHLAAQFGHLNVVKALINFGAKVHVAMNSGEYPIHLAVHSLDEATVDLFIDYYHLQGPKECKDVVSDGPSLWHALVAGIFYNVDSSERSPACGATLRGDSHQTTGKSLLQLLILRSNRAIEIAKRLQSKLGDGEIFKITCWGDHLPSQALWERFRAYVERPSDFCAGSAVGKDSEVLMAATRTFEMLRQLLAVAEHGACAQ